MMDGSEEQKRSHREKLKLTPKQLQVDCFHQATEEVAFCITYCSFILLLGTYIAHGHTVSLARLNYGMQEKRQRRYNFLQAPEEDLFSRAFFSQEPELETHTPSLCEI